MERNLAAAAASALVFCIGNAHADNHEQVARRYVPVETFTCNYREGKGPGALDEVVASWNEWMDDNDQQDYFAVTLTPYYFGGNTFDVGWLGSWPSGGAMGIGTDLWLDKGSEIGMQFYEVLDCDSHTNFAATEFKSAAEGPTPDTIVLSFSDCKGPGDPSGYKDLMAGLEAWAKYQAESDYHAGTWVMFPVYGGGDFDYDFKMIYGWDNHTESGQDYQRYSEQEDWDKEGELLGGLMDCDVPRLYNGTVRRRPAQED